MSRHPRRVEYAAQNVFNMARPRGVITASRVPSWHGLEDLREILKT